MGYNARGGSTYNVKTKKGLFKRKGKRSADFLANQSFHSRSPQAKRLDLIRLAPLAPNIEAYLRSPNRYDWLGVDGIAGSFPEQAKGIASLSKEQPDVELIVNSKCEGQAQTKKFKVIEKDEAKEETARELERVEEQTDKTTKNNLPTTEEIYAEAVRLWRKENTKPVHEGFLEDVADPTRQELKEEGYLNQAKLNLMTSDDTVTSRQTLDYVDNIRVELEKIGFTVIPLEGFSVEDLSF